MPCLGYLICIILHIMEKEDEKKEVIVEVKE